ncbi:flagellin lysine-N-methylase [Gottfriedia solisilvae]|uniref:Lysine-N-methylase n=1 Tax=Gottfriedia solisilvae TaxID=1516104 RepID=A0A8J3ATX8_9BACI|nr:flagellin lysine-N-methylase [Gottfriedia solisilvae]GGI16511.1 lysine-N-methylase [Gottfriedia solisilvae]
MGNVQKQTLIPEYMKHFSCIGSECEDTCCNGWTINIDKNTYKKYKNLSSQKIKDDINKNIKRNKKNSSEGFYAEFPIGVNGCSMLSETGLCRIHSELGESYLSNTCTIFPRSINKVNNVLEIGASLSCPEIARLVLLNPKGIDFEMTIKDDNTRGFTFNNINSNLDKFKLFWDIRSFAIFILQDKRYSVDDRLINLGMWISKLNEVVELNSEEKLLENINSFKETLNNQNLKNSLSKIKPNYDLYTKICYEILSIRKLYRLESRRYIELLNEISEGFDINGDTLPDDFGEMIFGIKEKYYNPYFKDHDYILENYLVNEVFTDCFGKDTSKIFEEFIVLVIKYSLIKLHLYGIASKYKELNDELIVYVIQSFSKCIGKFNVYLKTILELLKKNELNSLAHMAILIKG